MYFSFDFGLVRPSWFCPLRTGRVGEGRLLHGQNPLSVTNVICWQTLKVCFVQKFNSNKVFQILNLCFVKHWILNWQSFTENQEERTTWPPPPRQCQRCKFVILFKSFLHPYLSLHGKPFFFPRRPENMVFPKKMRWNLIFLVLLENIIFISPEHMILPPGGKWKMIFLKKIRGNMAFSSNVLKRWSFRKGPSQDMIFLVLAGKVVFFSGKHIFFPCTENERGMTFPGKYTETWYFLFDMFHAPLGRKKSKTTLCCKNTPKGDLHSRSTP